MSQNSVPEWWMPMNRPLRTHLIAVGCGAGRAMNRLYTSRRLEEVTRIAVNTDHARLQACRAPTHIHLEVAGLDAGGNPEIGRQAGLAAYDQLVAAVEGADVILLLVGLGGGTGSGAAPLIAEIAKAHGCLTVAVVTLPFHFEGKRRLATAEWGRQELQSRVDTLLAIPLQHLLSCIGGQTSLGAAFHYGDEVVQHTLSSVVQAISEVKFRVLFAEIGQACVATGVARGEHRATKAAWRAVTSPLLKPGALAKAQAVLMHLASGPGDLILPEVNDAWNIVREMTLAKVFIAQADGDHPQDELWVTVLAAKSPLDGGKRTA